MRVLGISTSPRAGGNTDLLLDEVLRGAKSAGAGTEKILLRELTVAPCIECGACERTGECVVQDDMQGLYGKLVSTDRLVLASPIYFMAHCAQAKAMIDRCQALWSRKYVLKKPLFDVPPSPPRKGMFVSVGGAKVKDVFTGAKVTMKIFFMVLEMEYACDLLYKGIDSKGEVLKHPTALKDAFEAGAAIAR